MAHFRKTRSLQEDQAQQAVQRNTAKKERKQAHLRHLLRWAAGFGIIAAVLVVLWASMGAVKLSNIVDFGRLWGRRGEGYPLSVSYGNLRQAVLMEDSIALLGPTQLDVFTQTGYTALTLPQPYASPSLQAAHGRAMLYDRALGKLTLLSKTGTLYQKELGSDIYCVDLAKNGSLAVATKAENAASELFVWDAKDTRRFAWRCEKEYPSALRLKGQRLGACLIGTEHAGVYARFVEFSFKQDQPSIDVRIDDAWLYGAVPVSDGWLAVGDQAVYYITAPNHVQAFSYEGRTLDRFDTDSDGHLAITLEDWDRHTLLRYYNKTGALVLEQRFPQRSLGIDCQDGTIYLRFEDALLRWRRTTAFRQSQPLPASTQDIFVSGNSAYLLTLRSVELLQLDWGPCTMLDA